VWCYEIAGREENEEVLIEDSNCDHLNSESQVNKTCKFKRQKGTPPNTFAAGYLNTHRR